MPIEKHGIESVLAHTLHDVLTDWCIKRVPTNDPSRADHVLLGKPTSERQDEIVVSIHMQHPLGPGADKDRDVSGKPTTQDDRPNFFPAGFNERWWKLVGTVQINVRQDMSYEETVDIVAAVVERVRAAINRDVRFQRLKDDWDNALYDIETFQAYGHASGGGDVSINLRWVDWRATVLSQKKRDLGRGGG